MPGWRCLAGSKRAAAGATSSEGGDGGGGGFGEAGVASPPFSTSRCPLPSHACTPDHASAAAGVEGRAGFAPVFWPAVPN